jgi:hypothetical protein
LAFTHQQIEHGNQELIASKLNNLFTLQPKESAKKVNDSPLFVFSNVYKHDKLSILDEAKRSTLKSNITALKPQYALICPSMDYNPQKQQNWSIKIKNCRNFSSSKNTIALGLCSLN